MMKTAFQILGILTLLIAQDAMAERSHGQGSVNRSTASSPGSHSPTPRRSIDTNAPSRGPAVLSDAQVEADLRAERAQTAGEAARGPAILSPEEERAAEQALISDLNETMNLLEKNAGSTGEVSRQPDSLESMYSADRPQNATN